MLAAIFFKPCFKPKQMKKNISIFLFLFSSYLFFAQNTITAKVEIDKNKNLNISQNIDKKNEIFIFPNYISLDENSAKFLKEETAKLNSYVILNPDIKYAVNNEKLNGKLLKNEDFFIITSRYLGLNKKDFLKEKRFNIQFSSDDKNPIIFPTEEDLKKKFITSPIIVAGNFKSIESNGFKIYYLAQESDILDEIKRASEGMEKSYDFYSQYFGKKDKPKIVFAPIQGPSENNENIIFYNSKTFKEGLRTTISHEIGHLWFGGDGIIFQENPLTEGITEFIALEYLTSRYGEKKFEELINYKFYLTEGEKKFKNLSNINLDKKEQSNLSYNLLPLYLYTKQKSGENILKQLSEFYKYKEDKRTTNLDEFNFFLQSRGYKELFTEDIPEFFVGKCNISDVCVYATSNNNYNLEIECLSNDNQKSRKTLSINKANNPQILEIQNYKKITIDPDFKIQQVSRLNDIWNKNEDNVFDKNRYFGINSVKAEIATISNELANYFTNPINSYIFKNLIIDNSQTQEFERLKNKYSNSKNGFLTGASASFNNKNNSAFLNFAFYDKLKKEINVLKLTLKLSNDNTKLESLKTFE